MPFVNLLIHSNTVWASAVSITESRSPELARSVCLQLDRSRLWCGKHVVVDPHGRNVTARLFWTSLIHLLGWEPARSWNWLAEPVRGQLELWLADSAPPVLRLASSVPLTAPGTRDTTSQFLRGGRAGWGDAREKMNKLYWRWVTLGSCDCFLDERARKPEQWIWASLTLTMNVSNYCSNLWDT